jgi:hypothetical protein
MLHGDPELQREVREENKKRPLGRRDWLLILAAVVAGGIVIALIILAPDQVPT